METDRLYEQRVEKLTRLREAGVPVYDTAYAERTTIARMLADFAEGTAARLAGRLVSLRGHGRSVFADLRDASAKIQLYFRKDILGDESYRVVTLLDIGDIVGVEGELFVTKAGEKTLLVRKLAVLTKALREPPIGKMKDGQSWYSLADVETRYRQRYLDMISNEEFLQVIKLRSGVVRAIRSFLDEHGFCEVETPMMQPLPGGAAARPFVTHHHALDRDLYLRIAPELYLKRLLVGGMERIYELNRNFRNEGISTRHNPEFTMLEAYQAYADYREIMALVEELCAEVCRNVRGGDTLEWRGETLSLAPPWRRVTLFEAIDIHAGVDLRPEKGEAHAGEVADALGLRIEGPKTYAKIVDETLKTCVIPELKDPTFLMEYPVELSPLAKHVPDNPRMVERFQAFIGGLEICNAFSELSDPIEQRSRFETQGEARCLGDCEAHQMDEDFILALEYGMPPAGGLGIGIDRFAMLLAGKESIRDVIIFPQLRN